MNKYIKKLLNKNLIIGFFMIFVLNVNTMAVNAIPNLKKCDKYLIGYQNKINELVPLNDDIGLEWSNPNRKAIYSNSDGHIFVLDAKVVYGKDGEEQQYITVDEYDSLFSYLSGKIVLLPYNCWGGVYNCEDGNFYVVIGQNNKEQDDSKIVYSVIKYNSEWKEIKRVNITGKESETEMPFISGKCDISFNNSILTVRDLRKAYTKLSLNKGEEEFSFSINTMDMKIQ